MAEMIAQEIWKPVVDWPWYQISSLGRVIGKRGQLAIFPVRGYSAFNVIDGTRRRSLRVHQEVARAHIGPPMPGQVCRHLDGNKCNNSVSNLAWGTPVENEQDKERHGRSMIGERNHRAKLKVEQVRLIRSSPLSGIQLARQYGVSNYIICAIRRGSAWRKVS
jgi:hypothetical protein